LKAQLYFTIFCITGLFTCCNFSYNSVEKQCSYLQNIADAHEEAVQQERTALKQYGYKSKAHNLALRKRDKAVKESQIKIEEFFRLYGFPTKAEHGPDFVEIPRAILVDFGRDYNTCKRNLKYFYDGWQKGDVDNWMMVRYLQVMYLHQFGDILRLENPYTDEMQLEALMKALEIDQYEAIKK